MLISKPRQALVQGYNYKEAFIKDPQTKRLASKETHTDSELCTSSNSVNEPKTEPVVSCYGRKLAEL